jgi:hypothetical protein
VSSTEVELSHAAKAAIRKYMLTLVAIPGVILTVAAAIAGYVFSTTQDIARQSAVLEAKVQAQTAIAEIQRDIANLSSSSRAALTLSQRDQEEIQATDRRLKTTLDALGVAKDVEGVIKNLEATLDKNVAFQESVARQVRPGQIIVSEVLTTPGDCAPARTKVLGSFPQLKFCSLSMSQTYRHGQNKGGLSCQVAFEQNQWTLIASGPTHECGSLGGATSGQCQAVCWQ